MDLSEARSTAEAFLDERMRPRFSHEIVILGDFVKERGDAWVFPYNGRGYVERGDINEAMAGNAPLAVSKETGAVTFDVYRRGAE
ncbi:YrhB domain-containing protein [Actinoplanes sp. NPDC020271]|uniref:YrhB domain-containing protein n=1 Tax=Actinoplanes sp. NPDC020271 TaxID=3363896 RepID=UPI00379BA5D5